MEISTILTLVGTVIGLIFLALLAYAVLALRRVVPTNVVHIVQSTKRTTPYGQGKTAGNTYYQWPTWIPFLGVSVTEFPESIFKVTASDYEAYDQVRLPFVVDVVAFFRVSDAAVIAQRVANFQELQSQLDAVLKGAVRRILAMNTLEAIMEARGSLGDAFTQEVEKQIAEWGVKTVKTIEFMDLRDNKKINSSVIENIMAKEQSRIDRESRMAVADNRRQAENAEIDANRTVEIQRQEAAQLIGLRTAEKDQAVGIAQEQATQQIQEQAALTAARTLAVTAVERERTAEIEKTVLVTQANAAREAMQARSEGDLFKAQKDADATRATGDATAAAQAALLLAPVTAQIQLAKEIGENSGYQDYLIRQEQVRGSVQVGEQMANALRAADLRVIMNGGGVGDAMSGVTNLVDLFSTKGGTAVSGLLASLSQTVEGASLLKRLGLKADEPAPSVKTAKLAPPQEP